jgi:hypothetical protein
VAEVEFEVFEGDDKDGNVEVAEEVEEVEEVEVAGEVGEVGEAVETGEAGEVEMQVVSNLELDQQAYLQYLQIYKIILYSIYFANPQKFQFYPYNLDLEEK